MKDGEDIGRNNEQYKDKDNRFKLFFIINQSLIGLFNGISICLGLFYAFGFRE